VRQHKRRSSLIHPHNTEQAFLSMG
jgi:hypothetical protein